MSTGRYEPVPSRSPNSWPKVGLGERVLQVGAVGGLELAARGWPARISFEDMVLNAVGPVRGLFTDEDRRIAEQSLGDQRREIERRREATEAAVLERDRRIVAGVAARRRAEGKPWTAEIEARMLAERAARRRTTE